MTREPPADTICAIATATGGGIGVVRLSGPSSRGIARALVRPFPDEPESHRLYHGWVHDPGSGEALDEVLVAWMRAPRSYTGEDVVEIQGHGGAASLGRLLEAAIAAGARLAEPGEFTRRAFLAGRIDLTRAEAVAELVAARSERAARVARAHLRGAVATRVGALVERLVTTLAEVEARVDFPEEDLDFAPPEELAAAIAALGGEVAALASSYARGRRLVEGVDVALVGRPNAGKSSLLNVLAGEERALVDAAPGTTRDYVEAELDLGGVRATLVDTAGEREAVEEVERRGLELGRRRRARADVALLVVDGTVGITALEERLWREAIVARVLVWNKADLAPAPTLLGAPFDTAPIATSATTGLGRMELLATLRRAAGVEGEEAPETVTSARQKRALDECAEALARAATAQVADAPPELVAVDLRAGLARLREITGEAVDADVLHAIFSRFCIGK